MNVDIIIKDGGVCLALSPENDMEKEILKTLSKQDNDIHEARSLTIFNKVIRDSVIIAGKSANLLIQKDKNDTE